MPGSGPKRTLTNSLRRYTVVTVTDANAAMRTWFLVMPLILAGCAQQQRVGDFVYDCLDGAGPFDGFQCRSAVAQRVDGGVVELWISEGDGPRLQYRPAQDSGSAGLLPPIEWTGPHQAFPETPIVQSLGVGDSVLVARATGGQWYVISLTENASGQNWPLVQGPLNEQDARQAVGTAMPRMRDAR